MEEEMQKHLNLTLKTTHSLVFSREERRVGRELFSPSSLLASERNETSTKRSVCHCTHKKTLKGASSLEDGSTIPLVAFLIDAKKCGKVVATARSISKPLMRLACPLYVALFD